MNEQWALPQNANGLYPSNGAAPGMLDGSMFNANTLDFSQLQNGAMRNASPAFHTPQYNVNQVIPSKRPRPSEDSIAQSPRQPPNQNLSRSQTPHQQPGGGFQGFPGGQQQPPNPYQHLQQGGSGNATPSPTIQDAQFRPPTAGPRMNASPSPFPPGSQPGMGMSPPPDANGNRVATPHNQPFGMNGMGMPPSSMPQGFNQNFGGAQGMGQSPMPGGAMPQLSENLQQRQMQTHQAYQMRMRAQQQSLAQQNAMAMAQGNRGMMGQMGPMANSPGMQAMQGQNPNMNTPTRNPQAAQSMLAAQQQFMKGLQGFMTARQKPFNPSPAVYGKPISLYQLYMFVMKAKGSAVVSSKQMWPGIAQMMGFGSTPQIQFQAAQELRLVYEQNLAPYESAYWRARQQNQNVQQTQANQQAPDQQMSPTRQMTPNASNDQRQMLQQQYMQQISQQQGQAQQQQMQHQMTPVQSNVNLPQTNGWSTPQAEGPGVQRQGSMGAPRGPKPEPSPALSHSGLPAPSPAAPPMQPGKDLPPQPSAESQALSLKALRESTHYEPRKYWLEEDKGAYGGYSVTALNELGRAIDIMKPTVPDVEEMGVIDIQALCMSLQSGLEAEVRYALDHLMKLSHTHYFLISLEKAPDLVDVLIDCADEQVSTLKQEGEELSDVVELISCEDLYRLSKAEIEGLHDIPEFGTKQYELEKAANRIVAITTLLRNLSFVPQNHQQLANETVTKFLSTIVRLIGTREKLLRSYTNTYDFMKDVVTFLSNVADSIELPSREDALNVLHFLTAFAPQPSPSSSKVCMFGRYTPGLQRYLPPAVDALAKLLARDEPNRAHYRYLFQNDPSSINPKLPPHQQYELITRAFGLAISVIPDRANVRGPQAEYRISEVRKPYLIQGMLAADILATLVPNSDSGLARTWLEAEDGWAPSLLRLACTLSTDRSDRVHPNNAPQQPGGPRPRHQPDHELGFGMVTHRALGMLHKLGEKTKTELLSTSSTSSSSSVVAAVVAAPNKQRQVNGETNGDTDAEQAGEAGAETIEDAAALAGTHVGKEDPFSDDEGAQRKRLRRIMADVLPQREVLLGALLTPNIEAGALKQLCHFAALEPEA